MGHDVGPLRKAMQRTDDIAAARAAVVEAACEFVADHGPAGETFAALTRAVDALEALEQSDA